LYSAKLKTENHESEYSLDKLCYFLPQRYFPENLCY